MPDRRSCPAARKALPRGRFRTARGARAALPPGVVPCARPRNTKRRVTEGLCDAPLRTLPGSGFHFTAVVHDSGGLGLRRLSSGTEWH